MPIQGIDDAKYSRRICQKQEGVQKPVEMSLAKLGAGISQPFPSSESPGSTLLPSVGARIEATSAFQGQ